MGLCDGCASERVDVVANGMRLCAGCLRGLYLDSEREAGVLRADLTEARAEIAALRGLPEGAVSEHWRCESGEWVRPTEDDRCAFVAHPDGTSYRWVHLTPGRRASGHAPTLRDAMRAADKAAGVGS